MSKVILVTGSGSGIGRAIGLQAAISNHAVIINDINRSAGEKVLSELQAAGGEGIFVEANVTDSSDVSRMFKIVQQKYGRIDILVNNAGSPGTFSMITEMSDSTWMRTINVHLTGTFYCLREAARIMIPAKSGRIVNIASIAGLSGTVGSAEYSAAKAGIIGLTKTAAKELGVFNITVNAIAPGMVATDENIKLQNKHSKFIKAALAGTPTGRMTAIEEIAGLVLFLCSPAAANISGQVIAIDGSAGINMTMDDYMRRYVSGQQP